MKSLVLSRILVLSFFSMLCSFSSIAEEYIVDQSNFGTALLKVSPGDTIVFKDGTYTNMAFNLTVSGTKEQPIVVRAETIGGVVFNGDISSFSIKADYNIIDGFKWADIKTTSSTAVLMFSGASNNVFRNNTIINSGRTTSGSKTGILRLMGGSKNNVIEYNRLDNLVNMGIQVWAYRTDNDNTGNIIRYNHFVNHKGLEFIQLGQGGSSAFVDQYSLVEHNLFEDFDMADPELISSKTSHNTIRYNTFRNCFSMLTLRTGEGTRVEGNWFFNSHGIRVHDKNHVIINNYIEGVSTGGYSGDDEGIVLYCGNMMRPADDGSHYPADSVLLANTTVINHINQHILVGKNSSSWSHKPTGSIIKNNLVANNVGPALTEEAAINVQWINNIAFSSATGSAGNVANVLKVDPLLSLEDGIYKLQQGSPAINSAATEAIITIDIEGQNRDDLDIGADEYSNDDVKNKPLHATDVGPGVGLKKYLLNTSVTGLGNIILDPSGNVYDSASVVTITAVAADGYKFDSWSGISGNSPTQTIIIDGDKTITANFVSAVPIIPIDTVWATSSDGNDPENTIDNDMSTRWSAEDGPQSITYQLDSLYIVEYLMIAWYNGDKRKSYFEIAVSTDSITWDTIAVDTSSGSTVEQEKIDIPDSEAKYVRYIGYGNSVNDWNSITEVDIHGALVPITGINNVSSSFQNITQLINYPNPFTSVTTISFNLKKPEQVNLDIFSINGHKVITLVDDLLPAGKHAFTWNVNSERMSCGTHMGLYICRLKTSSLVRTRKIQYVDSF